MLRVPPPPGQRRRFPGVLRGSAHRPVAPEAPVARHRLVFVGDARCPARFACRQAPTKTKTRCPCRSQPAGESCWSTVIPTGQDSPAGKLLQKQKLGSPCRSQPAGESCWSTVIPTRQDSLAGKLLQKKLGSPCRSQPAGESCWSTVIPTGQDSPAGQLLQIQNLRVAG